MNSTTQSPVVTLTAAESKEIKELQLRVAGLRETQGRCTGEHWKARCDSLRTEIGACDQPGPALDAKIAELIHAVDMRVHAKAGELQDVKHALRLTADNAEKAIGPILTAAAERSLAPLVEEAGELQESQNRLHADRGIPQEPCPAAEAIKATVEDVLRRARAGDLRICEG